MKKILSTLMTFSLLMVLGACGKEVNSTSSANSTSPGSSTPSFDHGAFMLPSVTGQAAVIGAGGDSTKAKENPDVFTYYASENCVVTKHEFVDKKVYFSYTGGEEDGISGVQLAYSQLTYNFQRKYEVSYKVKASVNATLMINRQAELQLLANQEKVINYTVKANDCQMWTSFGGQPGEYVFYDFYMKQLPVEVYTPAAPLAGGEYFFAPTGEETIINGGGSDTHDPVANRGKFVYWEARYIDWTNGVSATKVTASYDATNKVVDYSFIVTEGNTVDNVESGFWAAQLFYSSPATINGLIYNMSVTIEAAQDATIRVCETDVELKAGVPKVVTAKTLVGNDDRGDMKANITIQFGWMPTGWPSGEIFPGSYKLYNWSIKA